MSEFDISVLLEKAASMMNCDIDEISWYSWPETFPSAAGPRTGGMGAQMISELQVYGFVGPTQNVKCCCDYWVEWDGQVGASEW